MFVSIILARFLSYSLLVRYFEFGFGVVVSLLRILLLLDGLFAPQLFLIHSRLLLYKLSLVLHFEFGEPLVALQSLLIVLISCVLGNLRLAILLAAEVGGARYGSDTNVLVDEVVGGEVDECIVGLEWVVIGLFTQFC